jgi:hypothetical protein
MLGRYHFTLTDSILRGDLGLLRDPDTLEELFASKVSTWDRNGHQ